MTARQHRAWQVWLDDDYNQPSRQDFYSMVIAMEVARVGQYFLRWLGITPPKELDLRDFLVKFGQQEKPKKTVTIKQESAFVKAQWLQAVGLHNVVRK